MRNIIRLSSISLIFILASCGVSNESVVREAENNQYEAKEYFDEIKDTEEKESSENIDVTTKHKKTENSNYEHRTYKLGQPIFITTNNYGTKYNFHFVGFINTDTFVLSKRRGHLSNEYPEHLYYINYDNSGVFEIPENGTRLKVIGHTADSITLSAPDDE